MQKIAGCQNDSYPGGWKTASDSRPSGGVDLIWLRFSQRHAHPPIKPMVLFGPRATKSNRKIWTQNFGVFRQLIDERLYIGLRNPFQLCLLVVNTHRGIRHVGQEGNSPLLHSVPESCVLHSVRLFRASEPTSNESRIEWAL